MLRRLLPNVELNDDIIAFCIIETAQNQSCGNDHLDIALILRTTINRYFSRICEIICTSRIKWIKLPDFKDSDLCRTTRQLDDLFVYLETKSVVKRATSQNCEAIEPSNHESPLTIPKRIFRMIPVALQSLSHTLPSKEC